MIKICKISKIYNKQVIVDNLSLKISKGKVFGFLGPNGAGKTTTIKMLVGLNKPDSGTISINNTDPADPATRQKLGFMPENPYFYDHLSGLELLKFCYELSFNMSLRGDTAKQSKTDQIAAPSPNRMAHNDRNIYDEILDQVGLIDAKDKKIRTYSKGMKQRLGLAQAIIHDPDYIFLDEPLDGLDPVGRIEIKEIIKKLKKQGKTIFFNSHILSDVEEICDEIGIINQGHLIYSGEIKKFCGKLPLEKAFVEAISKGKSKV